jgi:hypothetical protein
LSDKERVMNNLKLEEAMQIYFPHDDFNRNAPNKGARGIIEFIIKDRNGNVINRYFEPNIVKIFAKEMLSHRLPSTEVWDQQSNGGEGAWVATNADPDEEFAARYILFGASFDENGIPLDSNDSRYYQVDSVTGQTVPIRLTPGAEYDGGLINAVPLTEPGRPLKKVEEIGHSATYQPSGSPLVQDDVRGINNIVSLSTVLRLEEYNGLGLTESDYFTIAEVALAGGRKIDHVEDCECTPRTLFLEGIAGTGGTEDEIAVPAIANGSDTITIDPSTTQVDLIKEGDQIKVVGRDDTKTEQSIDQTNDFYLVLAKNVGGRDVQLDRTVVDSDDNPISGDIGFFRDTLRIFSHRVLTVPVKKSADFEINVIWRIIFN